jgi:hypothetical protein
MQPAGNELDAPCPGMGKKSPLKEEDNKKKHRDKN